MRRLAVLGALVTAACGGTTDAGRLSFEGEWATADTIPGYRDIRLRFGVDAASLAGTWSAVAIREAGSPTKTGQVLGEERGDSVIIRIAGFGHTFRGLPVTADSMHGRLVSGGGVSTTVVLYPETPFTSEFGFRRRTP
jgi:hypothetical protein